MLCPRRALPDDIDVAAASATKQETMQSRAARSGGRSRLAGDLATMDELPIGSMRRQGGNLSELAIVPPREHALPLPTHRAGIMWRSIEPGNLFKSAVDGVFVGSPGP